MLLKRPMNSLKNKKLITIIICCYNHEKYLTRCLDSIVKQKGFKSKFDIIFVDDHSKDDSIKKAEKILPKKNSLLIKNFKNIGLVKSCNKAIKKTKTKYFIRVDSDDFISNKFIKYFEKEIHKDFDLIFCDRIEFKNSKRKIIKNKEMNIFKMISCGVALKTKKVLKLGGYKDFKWEEYDLYLRYLNNSTKIKNIKKNLYYYRKHIRSMSSNDLWQKKAWKELEKKYSFIYLNKFGNYKG